MEYVIEQWAAWCDVNVALRTSHKHLFSSHSKNTDMLFIALSVIQLIITVKESLGRQKHYVSDDWRKR